MDSPTDFKVVIGKNNIISVPLLSTALHYCLASYYIYNIAYPPSLKSFMLFLEKYRGGGSNIKLEGRNSHVSQTFW